MPPIVLIVDDDQSVRVMLGRLLRNRGYTVLLAADAREAGALIAGSQPSLVVSDIVMPGESGIDLRRATLERFPALPFILISGYSADGPAEFVARTPLTTFVQKPFSVDQFLDLVESILGTAGRPG